ncbi:MAG: ABC transporter substrate-binding protein [Alphaproteobacteria bacterium]|nr:ABC transporter substrate-binding protein [Alphaproteobacteria bacterium]
MRASRLDCGCRDHLPRRRAPAGEPAGTAESEKGGLSLRSRLHIGLVCALLAAALFCAPAHAAKTEKPGQGEGKPQKGLIGLAMHGAPKYAPGFQHLDYVNPDAPKGGALKLAVIGSFDNLNDNIITGNNAAGLDYISDKLMQRVWDEPFTLYGLVAQTVDVAADRSWIVYHLNPKARFHDGTPMTADDVKYSFEMLKKYGHPVRRRVYGLVTKVEISDPHTIKFTFGPGYDHECVMILSIMPVLPEHYWKKHDITKTTLVPPLGSGPYKIASVDPGRKITYERVKDYWAKDLPVNRGLYNFDTISYTYFRDDGIALQSFKSGEENLRRESDITKWKTQYDFPALRDGAVKREEIVHHRPEWLRAFVFNTRRPMFADRRVREALADIFNDRWINKTFYFGELKKIDSVYPNSELAARGKPEGEELRVLEKYRDDLPPEVFGPAFVSPAGGTRAAKREAIRLLKEAGWEYKDETLVNAKTGLPFSFEILLSDRGEEKVALAYARDLRSLGISAHVRLVDNAQYVGRLDDFDFDMVGFHWVNSLSPGNEQVNYWGTAAADTHGSRNYAGITNPAVNALADSIARATDREDLVARARALDRAIMYGYYMIPLFYLGKDLVAYASDIHRPSVTPVYGMVLESWWARPANKNN